MLFLCIYWARDRCKQDTGLSRLHLSFFFFECLSICPSLCLSIILSFNYFLPFFSHFYVLHFEFFLVTMFGGQSHLPMPISSLVRSTKRGSGKKEEWQSKCPVFQLSFLLSWSISPSGTETLAVKWMRLKAWADASVKIMTAFCQRWPRSSISVGTWKRRETAGHFDRNEPRGFLTVLSVQFSDRHMSRGGPEKPLIQHFDSEKIYI